jgi:hypothetical protein
MYDKTNWGDGPWNNEPDRLHWVDGDTGLYCLIVRNRMGALCGYVGLPEGHPLYGKTEEADEHVAVHGGITYGSGVCAGEICHTHEEAANEPVWWLGFDAAHAGDYCPNYGHIEQDFGVYRDIPYVQGECRSLAKQVKEYVPNRTDAEVP